MRAGDSEWMPSPLDPAVTDKRIRQGNQIRKRAKIGTWRRLCGNCKQLATLAFLVTASTLAATGNQVSMMTQSVFGSSRPDLLEVFAGGAEVSLQFARRGWFTLEPCDILYGSDPSDPQERDRIESIVREQKPRLVIISFPCRFWSKLTDTNFRTPQERRRLQKLRKAELPFLELCERIFEEQLRRGDDALGENPLWSAAFRTPPLRRILDHPEVHRAVSHGCRYGLKHPKLGLFLKKPTLWFSTSREICDELSKKCCNSEKGPKHVHAECQGGSVTKHAAKYTPEIARAIHRGFVSTLKRKDPSRLRRLLLSIRKRLGAEETGKQELKWTLKGVNRVLNDVTRGETDFKEHLVEAVDQGESEDVETPNTPVKVENPKIKVCLARDGIHFEVPVPKRLDAPMRTVLKKVHCNLGHPSEKDLKRFLQNAGAPSEMLEAVGWLKCSACAKSARPRIHRSTRLPPHDIQFNDQIMLDCFHVKDCKHQGHWFLSVLDRATMYHQVTHLKNHGPATFVQGLMECWIRWAGTPVEISVDMERGLVSREFVDTMSEGGTRVIPIAGQAHWQHGKIERHGSILKDMINRVVREAKVKGEEQMEWLAMECTQAKNMLIREHGFSPNQLVFGKEPRVFGEIEENGEPCAYHFNCSDPKSRLARHMKMRHHARIAYVHAQSSQLLNRTARNKTRAWKEPGIGDQCFFLSGSP